MTDDEKLEAEVAQIQAIADADLRAMLAAMKAKTGRDVGPEAVTWRDLLQLASEEAVLRRRLVARVDDLERRLALAEERGVKFCGVHQRALDYERGSAVTSDGSLWIALRAVAAGENPGACDGWQLAVKRKDTR